MRNLLTFRKYFIWPSNWFCDYHYHRLLSHDLKMQYYLQSVFYRLRLPTSQFIITRLDNKTFIEFTFYIANAFKNKNDMLFYMKRNRFLLWSSNSFSVHSYHIYKKISQLLFTMLFEKKILYDVSIQLMYVKKPEITLYKERELRVIWFLQYINVMHTKIHRHGSTLNTIRSKYYITSRNKRRNNTIDSNYTTYNTLLGLKKHTILALTEKAFNFNFLYHNKLKTLYKLYRDNVSLSIETAFRASYHYDLLNLNQLLQVNNVQTRTRRTKIDTPINNILVNNKFLRYLSNVEQVLHHLESIKVLKKYKYNNLYIYGNRRYNYIKFNINKMLRDLYKESLKVYLDINHKNIHQKIPNL